LFIVNKLSTGQFGDLYLVKDKKDNEFVAKTMSKYELEDAEVSEFIIDESEVMSVVSFPFVVRCGKKFQSKHHLIYLTEYVKGE
jgi:serine/threonine protein kinase